MQKHNEVTTIPFEASDRVMMLRTPLSHHATEGLPTHFIYFSTVVVGWNDLTDLRTNTSVPDTI